MEDNNGAGVRKGAWTKEEDILLRNCINEFGVGRWHLVPLRAGLNRCRKSCRMRWLNYLSPDVKRGRFSQDEVDLLLRLHKLLGNKQVFDLCYLINNSIDLKWSLIAGRLPGRTANDVKNFWNSHISKKPPSSAGQKTITSSNIIRPKPQSLSKSQPPPWWNQVTRSKRNDEEDEAPTKKQVSVPSSSSSLANDPNNNIPAPNALLEDDLDECFRWWENLLEDGGKEAPFRDSGDEQGTTEQVFVEDQAWDWE